MEEYAEFGDHHYQGESLPSVFRPIALFWAREVSGIWAADLSAAPFGAGDIADWLADRLRSSVFVLPAGSLHWRLMAERRLHAPAGPILGVVPPLPAWLSVICPPLSALRPSPGSFAERVRAASCGAPLRRAAQSVSESDLPDPDPGSVAAVGVELLLAANAARPVASLAA
jgi:hypothetical protein